MYGLCPYMVFAHIWSLPIYGLCPYMVFAHIWSLGLVFLPTVLNSIVFWVWFSCPTVLNPIYGLCPYMVSGSGFPANCVESYRLLGLISCPTVLNPIHGLSVCPYMVSGSGFPANCVQSYRLLGLVFLSHCVESHIWSLPIYGLWVWFSCQLC